ncbi:MAG TPA: tripartite tricarboxylate transporter substrate binding protein [Xanthobacteraceae bacterium]|nr:tripartite tricarboxylate transporter substrate binding protein [Xanthobacteraceae bacterium]
MKRFSPALRAGAFAFLALVWSAAPGRTDAYPSRPVTLIVPSSAGGPADATARLIVDRMSAALGQQIVIENVPGAGGTIGMARAARAAPDGYTLLIHQNGFAITPALYEKLSFDTEKDFVTVGLVNLSHTYLLGRKSLPPKTFAELAAWMNGPGKPGKWGHPGAGTNGHLQSILVMRVMGVNPTFIPYRGIAPAVNDLLGEHIDVAGVGAAVATRLVQAGKLKAFVSTASKRDPALPDVPTYGEVGHKELERPFWHALFAPAGTPRPVLERINAALRETLADPVVKKAFADNSVAAYPENQWSIAAAGDYIRNEIAFWGKVVRDNNVKLSH